MKQLISTLACKNAVSTLILFITIKYFVLVWEISDTEQIINAIIIILYILGVGELQALLALVPTPPCFVFVFNFRCIVFEKIKI